MQQFLSPQTLGELLINLIAGFIGFAIGWIWQRIIHEVRLAPARKVWRRFITEQTLIIINRNNRTQWATPTGFIEVGTARALGEIRTFFEKLGKDQVSTKEADLIEGRELQGNLIILGTIDVNPLLQEAITQITGEVCVINDVNQPLTSKIIDIGKNREYTMAERITDKARETTTDYGLIIIAKSPFNPEKRIILISGCSGYGVWCAAKFVISSSFLTEKYIQNQDAIFCIVETRVTLSTPQNAAIQEIRSLSNSGLDTTYYYNKINEHPELLLRQVCYTIGIDYHAIQKQHGDNTTVKVIEEAVKRRILAQLIQELEALRKLQEQETVDHDKDKVRPNHLTT